MSLLPVIMYREYQDTNETCTIHFQSRYLYIEEIYVRNPNGTGVSRSIISDDGRVDQPTILEACQVTTGTMNESDNRDSQVSSSFDLSPLRWRLGLEYSKNILMTPGELIVSSWSLSFHRSRQCAGHNDCLHGSV